MDGNCAIDLAEFASVSAIPKDGGNGVADLVHCNSKTNEISYCENTDRMLNEECLESSGDKCNNVNCSNHLSVNHLNNNSISGNCNNNNDGGHRKDLVTIVTISGCTDTESSTGEMDILAHL